MSRTEHESKISSSKEAWRNKLAQERGTIWPDIKGFVQMGMRPAEIAIALVQSGQRVIDQKVHKQIANAMGHRPRKGLSLRTPAERRSARIAALKETTEEREARVHTWLEVIELLEAKGLGQKPQGRLDWAVLVETFHERRLRTRYESAYTLFPEIPDEVYTEVLGKQKECLEAIQKATPLNGAEAARISNAMATHGEFHVDEARGH